MTQAPPAPAATEAAETLVALLATVQELWPAGEVEVTSSRARPAPGDVTLGVAPSLESPRLLVPSTRRAAARSLRRFSASASWRDAVTRHGAAGLSGVLGAAALPDRIVVRGGEAGSLVEHLGEVLGRRVQVSLGIGNARVNRKPVLQLFDEGGRVVGFAKVGDTDLGRADVAAEAEALRQVSSRQWRHLVVPDLLHSGTWQGLGLLVMTALPAGAAQAARDPWRRPEAAMAELAGAFDGGTSTLGHLPWWRSQGAAIERLADPHQRAWLGACHAALEERETGREWRIGAWHGDWTPWNMATTRRRVRVWDWERFETGVPVGLDAVHHTLNTHTREHGSTAASIQAALRDPRLGTAHGVEPHVVDAYLLAITVRYLTLATTTRGEHVVARGLATLDTLRGRLGR